MTTFHGGNHPGVLGQDSGMSLQLGQCRSTDLADFDGLRKQRDSPNVTMQRQYKPHSQRTIYINLGICIVMFIEMMRTAICNHLNIYTLLRNVLRSAGDACVLVFQGANHLQHLGFNVSLLHLLRVLDLKGCKHAMRSYGKKFAQRTRQKQQNKPALTFFTDVVSTVNWIASAALRVLR